MHRIPDSSGYDSAARYNAFVQERADRKAEHERRRRMPLPFTPELRALLRAAEQGDVGAMRDVAARVASHYEFNVDERTVMPDGAAAFFSWQTRTAVVPPITDSTSFAIRLHEFGHGVAGDCPRREPHRPDPTVRDWWHCIACETDAWAAAITMAPFSRTMFARLRSSLDTYRSMTPASPEAIEALDRVRGSVTWAQSIQAWRAREWRIERQAAAMRDVERDRERSRREHDRESDAFNKRMRARMESR